MNTAAATISSEHLLTTNDDILTEILIRLPIKSLLKFKLVSKHWLSLITNPQFCQTKSQNVCKDVSGLLVYRRSPVSVNKEFDFVPLDDEKNTANPPFESLKFVQDTSGIKLLQSCNGLLLFCSFRRQTSKYNYYIFNPTNRKFTTLPDPLYRNFKFTRHIGSVYAVNLAFDPRKSPYYKVICIYQSKIIPDCSEIEIYSSETGLWRHIGDPFSVSGQVNFQIPVYWNGSINWPSQRDDSLYFNLDEERLGTLPMPEIPSDWREEGRRTRYFGESEDHLHLIEIYGPLTTLFNVYEMDREYKGWFVKYKVDLENVMNAFPQAICKALDPSHLHYYKFLILDILRGKKKKDDDEDSAYLVLSLPGKAVRYNLVDGSFRKLHEFGPSVGYFGLVDDFPTFGWCDSFKFIESLIPV